MQRQLPAVVALVGLISSNVFGAGITTVLSSFDEEDPFDGWLYPAFEWERRTATISREYLHGDQIRRAKILNATRSTYRLSVNLRLGLWKDLELFTVLPFVLADQTSLSYASGAGSLDPSPQPREPDLLFDMPNSGPTRSGFGDMALGLRYSPFQQWRDPYYPSWVLSLTWTLPTGKVRRGGNKGVGNGWHELKFESSASRRITFLEPYFGFWGTLRIPGSSTLFKEYASAQGTVWPGQEVGIQYGIEFFPWERKRSDGKHERYASIDIGGSAVYTFRGRGYTDLFEAFATSRCNQTGMCVDPEKWGGLGLTQYDRTAANWVSGSSPQFMDGITDVEAYGTFSLWLRFEIQPIEYFSFGFKIYYARETGHYLTRAIVGEDQYGNGDGVKHNPGSVNEFNPVYNSTIDDPGRRFKSEGANILGIGLSLTGKI